MTTTTRLLRPLTITDAMLNSSTAPENDHAAWSGATTYAAGDRCIKTSTHRIYESAQAANLNHDPATDDGTWWLDVGPTNRWAMFDQAVGSQTSQATPLTVEIEPGAVIAGLALLDVEAATATITMTSVAGGGTVYSATHDMIDGADLLDWYAYFFDDIVPRDTLIIDDLPAYADGILTVALVAATTARCGTLAIGSLAEIGQPLAGAGIGIIDYSRKTTDDWGITTFVERSFAKRIEVGVMIDAAAVDYVARVLAAVRATPCVWIVAEAYSSLVLYGIARDWGIDIAYPTHAVGRLTLEGLT
jgi:hypothetical protein